MTQYVVRTKEGRTYLGKLDDGMQLLAFTYTDYHLLPDTRDISLEDIVEPKKKKAIARATLYRKKNYLTIDRKRQSLAAVTRKGEYFEDGEAIEIEKIPAKELLKKEEYKDLERMGLTHAYFVKKPSPISEVFCFEKNGDISGTISIRKSKEDDLTLALKGFALVMAKRIEDQEYLRAFMA